MPMIRRSDDLGRMIRSVNSGSMMVPAPGYRAEATNLVTNPSFETNTTGWVTGGTNTIARSTEQALFGANSLKITYADNAALAQFGITLTAVAHSFSLFVYIPTNYNGQGLQLTFVGFTGASGTVNAAVNMNARDTWQRVVCPNVTPAGGDLAGAVNINATGTAPTAGRFIYIDGAQVEATAAATEYLDGSLFGCEWDDAAHGSISTRAADTVLP